MATPKQIAANKENAQKSTGPTSDAGRAASSRNHLTHGFNSNVLRIVPGEDPEEFWNMLVDFGNEYQPSTPTEQALVERLAMNQWLIFRAFRLQGEAFADIAMDQAMNKDATFGVPKTLGLLIRYQNSAERNFNRDRTELVKAQKERKKSEIGFEPQNGAEPANPEPKTAPQTPVPTDFPAATATSAAPNGPAAPVFTTAPLKNAA